MKTIANHLSLILLTLTILVYRWFFRNFGDDVTFEQFLWHIMLEYKHLDSHLKSSIKQNIIYGVIVTSLLFAIAQWLLEIHKLDKYKKLFNRVINFQITLFFTALIIVIFLAKLGAIEFIINGSKTNKLNELRANYKIDHNKNIDRRKNLILIYVESLESTINQKNNANYLDLLVKLDGNLVDNFKQATGANWSIAGMVASQCSMPLSFDAHSLVRYNMHVNYSLPSLSCLGDILKKFGYNQYFIVGCDKEFDDMSNFYLTHGYDSVMGKKEFQQQDIDKRHTYSSFGDGLDDKSLLDEAYKIIISASRNRTPYNLTLITMDTHAIDGFPSPNCPEEDLKQGILGLFRCTSSLLTRFINRLEQDGLLKDTVVIIMGDHYFMANEEQKKTIFSGNRDIFFKILGKNTPVPLRNIMNHFDVAPTILDLLGFNNNDSNTKFELGISLYNNMPLAEYMKHYEQVIEKKY